MLIILYLFRIFIHINKDNRFKTWQGATLFGIYLVYILSQYIFNFGSAHSV